MHLPLFLKTPQLQCLIIGGGSVAARKVELLLCAACNLTVIAPALDDRIRQAADRSLLVWRARRYEPGDCKGFQLVIAATPHRETNRAISLEAQRLGVPVNVIDAPELCTVIFGASHHEGALTISVTTGGRAPFMAAAIRDRIRGSVAGMAGWIEAAGRFRSAVRSQVKDPSERARLYHHFAACARGDSPPPLSPDMMIGDWLEWLERRRSGE